MRRVLQSTRNWQPYAMNKRHAHRSYNTPIHASFIVRGLFGGTGEGGEKDTMAGGEQSEKKRGRGELQFSWVPVVPTLRCGLSHRCEDRAIRYDTTENSVLIAFNLS